MNLYDTDIHVIHINGAVTKTFPHQDQLDNGLAGGIITGAAQPMTDGTRLWIRSTAALPGPYFPRLLKIVCRSQTPTAGSTVTFCDVAGNDLTAWAHVFAADASDKVRDYWPGGAPMPKGGFGVTTTADNWDIYFTWSEAG